MWLVSILTIQGAENLELERNKALKAAHRCSLLLARACCPRSTSTEPMPPTGHWVSHIQAWGP